MGSVFQLAAVPMTNGRIAFDGAREANHRIANNLSLVVASLHMQARSIRKGAASIPAADVRTMLDEAAARIDAVGLLHRVLSQQSGSDQIDLGTQLRMVCDALVAAFAQRGEVIITYDLASCKASPNRATTISLLVTELVTNAIKYAHPTGIPTAIRVACRAGANGALHVAVEDDGVGLPVDLDPEKATSVGLEVIRALSRSLSAKVAFEDHGLGLTVRFQIPA
jgi:two-component sensor histidine kinase